jgi:protein-disulfide isomerase
MPEPALPRLHVPVGEPDHVRGPATSPVTLVEYGDYQCPFCGRAHPVVRALIAQLGNRMRFCFRHFPLTTIHPLAQQAAEAAEAATSASTATGSSASWRATPMPIASGSIS